MKNIILTAAVASMALVSCSTVSSVLQNTVPYTSNFVITGDSDANEKTTIAGAGTSLNQLMGVSNNVKDIRANSATVSISSGPHGMGIFKSVELYISTGDRELLVGSRDNIADNLGKSLSLDVSSRVLDEVMRSGNPFSQRLVYVLKSSPTSDMKIKSTISFTSVPVNK